MSGYELENSYNKFHNTPKILKRSDDNNVVWMYQTPFIDWKQNFLRIVKLKSFL